MDRYGEPSPTLSGRNPDARQDGHRHAHYVLLDVDHDRLLDTAVVWAPDGLTEDELAALRSINRLTSGVPGFRPVRVATAAVGSVAAVARELWGPSNRWVSFSPFAPYRHQKRKRTEEFLLEEVNRELITRDMAPAVQIHVARGDWLTFCRQRPGKGDDLRAVGLEIEFADSVQGPVVLGALSHFGLGVFLPRS